MSDVIIESFERQAEGSARIGAPFVAQLCRLIPHSMGETRLAERVMNWPGDARADALALRVCGGLHALVLTGAAPELARFYPPHLADEASLQAVLADAIVEFDDFLVASLDTPPQTNEPGRSSMLLGAALTLANLSGLPLSLFEIGASAGLNLWFFRYAYDLGHGLSWGKTDKSLTIRSEWSGAIPLLTAPLKVDAQKGCDSNPLNPADPGDRLRLLSYIWPEQPERLDRMRRALDHAAAEPVQVDKADAATWIEKCLAEEPRPGLVRMVYHTIVWQYLTDDTKARIANALAQAGAAARPETPLAWFRFEDDHTAGGEGGVMELTYWPGGETRVLGRADFHGRWVRWS